MTIKKDQPQVMHPMMSSQDRMAQMQRLVSSPDPLLAAQQMQIQEQEEEQVSVMQKDLKQLVFLGRIEDVKEIGGFEFKVRTLTSAEYDSVWLGLSVLGGSDKILLIKRPILARAIVSVNGSALDALYEGKNKDASSQLMALEVLSNWQESLVNQIFEFYNELAKRSNEVFSNLKEEIKK